MQQEKQEKKENNPLPLLLQKIKKVKGGENWFMYVNRYDQTTDEVVSSFLTNYTCMTHKTAMIKISTML